MRRTYCTRLRPAPRRSLDGSATGTIKGNLLEPKSLAVDASALYARNLFNFVSLVIDKDKTLKIDPADEIIKGTLLTRDGAVVHAALAKAEPAPVSPAPPSSAPQSPAAGTPATGD